MRYDNRTRSLIPFRSHEAFQIAYAKNREAQKSGQKRRAEEGTGESSPLRSMPPEQRQEMGGPKIGTQSTSAGASAQDTRVVTWKEAGDKSDEPPRQCKTGNAIVISDDSDGTVRPKTRATSRSQSEPAPHNVPTISEGKTTVPPAKAETRESSARDVKGGDLKRVRSPSVGRFRVTDQVRQVWGSKYQAGNENSSLPRPRESRPPCHKSVRKADVSVSKSYVPWTKNPEYTPCSKKSGTLCIFLNNFFKC